MTRSNFILALVGAASLLAYLAAAGLADLRLHTLEFEVVFFGAFILYVIAVAVVLRTKTFAASRWTLPLIAFFAVVFRVVLLPTRPTLSDDMYRYVWDGHVQALGISPYRYPPAANELADLRYQDWNIWRYINRKSAVTVYPPGAQLAYAGIWRIVGDSVAGFKAAFVIAELLGAWLLARLLRLLDQPVERILIYLWSPLLIFEVAQAGHVDGLMLPLLILAFWARVRNRPWLLGLSLGAATLVKLFPVILLPALIPIGVGQAENPARSLLHNLKAKFGDALKTLIGFAGIMAVAYGIYAFGSANPIGFLPQYFDENFNLGLAHAVFDIAKAIGVDRANLANLVTFGGLAILSIIFVLRPAKSGKDALIRCVWLIGWFTLTTQNLFAWYLLWLLPLIAVLVELGKLFGLKLAPMSAWLIFSGLIALSYMFFIHWRPVDGALLAEYVPLYVLLALTFVIRLGRLLVRSELAGRWLRHDARSPAA